MLNLNTHIHKRDFYAHGTLRFHIEAASRKTDSKAALIDYFESHIEKISSTPSLSSIMFFRRFLFLFGLGFMLCRGGNSRHSQQYSTSLQGSTSHPAAGAYPELHRLHQLHFRIFVVLHSATVNGLSGQRWSVSLFLTCTSTRRLIYVLRLAVINGN